MIVTVSGWVYVLVAILGCFQLKYAHATGEQVVMIASLAFSAVVGAGLILRRNWARWLALGASLFVWTVGSLALIWAVAKGIQAFAGPTNMPFRNLVGILVGGAVFAVFIWLNFRLFERLNSNLGRAEFHTPVAEKGAVGKSAAVQLVWSLLGMLMFNPQWFGGGSTDDSGAAAREAAVETPRQVLANEVPADDDDESTGEDSGEEEGESQLAAESGPMTQEEFRQRSMELTIRRSREPDYSAEQYQLDQQALLRRYRASNSGATQPAPGSPGQDSVSTE